MSNHDDVQNRTEMCCELPLLQQLHIYQHLNMLFVMVYLVFISMSFLFREHQLWQRHVKNNLLWFKLLGALTLVQILYTICAIFLIDNGVMVEYHWNDGIAPFEVWAVWIFGIPIVIGINEFVKRKEIKVEVRHQRRQRLEFGTKLGINSPF